MASSHASKLPRDETPVAAKQDQHAELVKLSQMFIDRARSRKSRATRLHVVGPNGETLALPASVVQVLERATAALTSGDAVAILPVGRELTTQQAADLLKVSRQYLVRLVDEHRLPCSKIGKHRRLIVEDVLAFKRTRDAERGLALGSLAGLTEDFGGYAREMK